jgi:hypothetical protein
MTNYIAYLDECGTHQGAKVSVMAGFVGDERQRRKFEKRSRTWNCQKNPVAIRDTESFFVAASLTSLT